MERLYVVVRADLSPAQQAVQAVHAAQAFAVEHPAAHLAWHRGSNTLALLAVEGEAELLALHRKARLRALAASLFREPDLGDQATALVLSPAARPLCKGLPLALAERRCAA